MERQDVKKYRVEIQGLLDGYAKEKGVTIKIGQISYDKNDFKASFTLVEAGNKEDVRRMDFEKHCGMFGLKKEDYGRIEKLMGKSYKLVGIKPKGRKYPLVFESMDNGNSYKFKIDNYMCDKLGLNEPMVV